MGLWTEEPSKSQVQKFPEARKNHASLISRIDNNNDTLKFLW